MRDDILIKLTEGFLSSKIDAKVDENTEKVSMDTGILFATDSAELSEAGKAYVDAFCKVYAPVILNDEYKDAISQVVFEGHTDTAGEYDYNPELSQKRADAVLAYCLDSTANSLSDEQKTELKRICHRPRDIHSVILYMMRMVTWIWMLADEWKLSFI